ncbi:NlpC/P60 family protein [Niveispirillum sp. KHB5.9]|uniref:NlpC/P60 family protein n=1 Tax=Niveispirillum sp. KHB5.9 TaxID=3400269 RepID=UPI003A84EE57
MLGRRRPATSPRPVAWSWATSRGSVAMSICRAVSSRNDVCRRALALVGRKIPYRHLGRDRHGLDCLGLMLWALDQVDNEHILTGGAAAYHANPDWLRDKQAVAEASALLSANLAAHMVKVKWNDRRAGDVIALSYKAIGGPDHVGIFINPNSMVHADLRRGVVIDELDGDLTSRLFGLFRWGK